MTTLSEINRKLDKHQEMLEQIFKAVLEKDNPTVHDLAARIRNADPSLHKRILQGYTHSKGVASNSLSSFTGAGGSATRPTPTGGAE